MRSWRLLFPSKIHSKIAFFRDAFLDLIFLHFMLIFCEKVRFLDPLWDPLGPKMAPKIGQVAPKWPPKNSPAEILEPTCFQDRIRNAPGHHFGRLWDGFSMIFNAIWYHFYSIFYKFLATVLHTTKAACPDEIGHAIRGQLPVTPPLPILRRALPSKTNV